MHVWFLNRSSQETTVMNEASGSKAHLSSESGLFKVLFKFGENYMDTTATPRTNGGQLRVEYSGLSDDEMTEVGEGEINQPLKVVEDKSRESNELALKLLNASVSTPKMRRSVTEVGGVTKGLENFPPYSLWRRSNTAEAQVTREVSPDRPLAPVTPPSKSTQKATFPAAVSPPMLRRSVTEVGGASQGPENVSPNSHWRRSKPAEVKVPREESLDRSSTPVTPPSKMTQKAKKRKKNILTTLREEKKQLSGRPNPNHTPEEVDFLLHKFEEILQEIPSGGRLPVRALGRMQKRYRFLYPEGKDGSLPEVEVGFKVKWRVELRIVGLHRPIERGIDFKVVKRKDDHTELLALSVVASNEYEDDEDDGETLFFTGEGGRDKKTKHQVEDQSLKRGNEALYNSYYRQNSIRVIRHRYDLHGEKFYIYDGLYKVQDKVQGIGKSGKMVWKFKLVREPGQKPLEWAPRLTKPLRRKQAKDVGKRRNENIKMEREDNENGGGEIYIAKRKMGKRHTKSTWIGEDKGKSHQHEKNETHLEETMEDEEMYSSESEEGKEKSSFEVKKGKGNSIDKKHMVKYSREENMAREGRKKLICVQEEKRRDSINNLLPKSQSNQNTTGKMGNDLDDQKCGDNCGFCNGWKIVEGNDDKVKTTKQKQNLGCDNGGKMVERIIDGILTSATAEKLLDAMSQKDYEMWTTRHQASNNIGSDTNLEEGYQSNSVEESDFSTDESEYLTDEIEYSTNEGNHSLDESGEEFEVEDILKHRKVSVDGVTCMEYLVQWKDYDESENSWEPEGNMVNAPVIVEEYWNRVG